MIDEWPISLATSAGRKPACCSSFLKCFRLASRRRCTVGTELWRNLAISATENPRSKRSAMITRSCVARSVSAFARARSSRSMFRCRSASSTRSSAVSSARTSSAASSLTSMAFPRGGSCSQIARNSASVCADLVVRAHDFHCFLERVPVPGHQPLQQDRDRADRVGRRRRTPAAPALVDEVEQVPFDHGGQIRPHRALAAKLPQHCAVVLEQAHVDDARKVFLFNERQVMTPAGGPYNALDQFEVVEEQPLCIHASFGGNPFRLSVRSIAKHKHSRRNSTFFCALSFRVRIFSRASVYTAESASERTRRFVA